MREPELRIGFIIFNPSYKAELESVNGHRKTAFNWIRDNGLLKIFNDVVGTNKIYDEEDFLMEYIGAIKLYGYGGHFYCRIPRIFSVEKRYYKKFYEKLGYKIISDEIYNEEKPKTKIYKYQYNKTVMKNNNNKLIYNPLKDGD